MEQPQILTLIIFILTYLGIIFTRLPGVNIDRPSAAFSGAVAMVALGILTPEEAVKAIDTNTIFLLLGMMIIIATLQLDGVFTWIARKIAEWSGSRKRLLTLLTFTTGISSAFLVNDAVVLMFTPVIIQLCRTLKINPVPYLLAEILASNTGSAMTITGNPQNMLIGLSSGLEYTQFMLHLLPVTLAGLLVIIWVIRLVYRSEFSDQSALTPPDFEPLNRTRLLSSGTLFGLVLVGFFIGKQIGFSIPLIAMSGAALILLFGKAKPSEVIRQVDWVLLLFFGSLFVVTGGVEKAGLLNPLMNSQGLQANAAGVGFLHGLSLLMSQIVSNVPFVVIMLPMMKTLASPLLWLSLASASTLAGNATLIGAMANLIVVESASREGVHIGFREFLKSGLIVTLISLPLSFAVLLIQSQLGWI